MKKIREKLHNKLNKHNADNIPELIKNIFKKMKKGDIPDNYVAKIHAKEDISPRKFDYVDMLERNRIADILPYEWFDEETNIYQTNRAHGFVFDCGTLVGCAENLDDQLKGLFSLGIPVGTCMQVLLLASSELEDKFSHYKSLRETPLLNKLASERINFYKKGLKQSLRPGHKFPVRDFRLVISFAFDGVYDESNRHALTSLQQSIGTILATNNINNQLMKPNEFINLVREILCTKSDFVEKKEYDKRRSIRSQISDIDNDIYIAADGLCINDMGVKSIAVAQYPAFPDKFELKQADKFIGDTFSVAAQISYPFFMVQNVTFLDASKENHKLHTAAIKTSQQVQKGKITALFPLFHRKHAEYQMLQHLISVGEGFMWMSHYIHVFYPLGQSETAFQEVKSLYQTFNWKIVTNSNLQLPTLLCSLPLNHDLTAALEQKKNWMTSLYSETNVVNTLPLFSDFKGVGKPILMFLSRRGQVQFFDLFQSSTNYNVAISANSGAGKSFFTNELVTSNRAVNTKVSVIDIGSSYKNTCAVLGGQFIQFTNEASIVINPFSFIKLKLADNQELTHDMIRKLTKEEILALEDLDTQVTMLKSIFLVSAGVDEGNENASLAESYLEQAIISSLQKHFISSTYSTVYDELLELAKIDNNVLLKDLANAIKSYTKTGIFGKYFEGQSNLDLDNDLVILELEELDSKGNLKFIVLMILMLKITQDMYLGNRGQRKICIIDEAWALMDGGNTGKFIATGYRRARKYNGAFVTITQKLDDYAMNATTMACYTNAAWNIMLSQNPPTIIKLKQHEVTLLQSVRSEKGVYSDLLIINTADRLNALCRFMVDDFTQFLYSTTADDVNLIKFVKEQEKADTVTTLERVISIIQAYTTKYKRSKIGISHELMQQINKYGYESIINDLGLQNIAS